MMRNVFRVVLLLSCWLALPAVSGDINWNVTPPNPSLPGLTGEEWAKVLTMGLDNFADESRKYYQFKPEYNYHGFPGMPADSNKRAMVARGLICPYAHWKDLPEDLHRIENYFDGPTEKLRTAFFAILGSDSYLQIAYTWAIPYYIKAFRELPREQRAVWLEAAEYTTKALQDFDYDKEQAYFLKLQNENQLPRFCYYTPDGTHHCYRKIDAFIFRRVHKNQMTIPSMKKLASQILEDLKAAEAETSNVVAVSPSATEPAPALGQALPCQADLEYYGLLPGTQKVYKGECEKSDLSPGPRTWNATLTQTVKKVTAEGDACRIEILETNSSGPDSKEFPRNPVIVYIYQGKLYGPLVTSSISGKAGRNPDRSHFGQPSDWGTYLLSKDLKPGSEWKETGNNSGCEEPAICSVERFETVSVPAGSFSQSLVATCTCFPYAQYNLTFKEKVGVIQFSDGGEGGGCLFKLASNKTPPPATAPKPKPATAAAPAPSTISKPFLVTFSAMPKDFKNFYMKGANCESVGCVRYNTQGTCEQYGGETVPPIKGLSVDLNQDGTPEYIFSCFAPAHGPSGADVFAKIGGKWKNLGPGFPFSRDPADLQAISILGQTDCGYHRFKFRFGDEESTYQFDGEKYVDASSSPVVKCKTPPAAAAPKPAPAQPVRPPIRFKGKDFTMCSDSATIKAIYPEVKEGDTAPAGGRKLVLELTNMDSAEFIFDHDRLVKLHLISSSTEGATNEIKDFEDWLRNKYGKGIKGKAKNPGEFRTEWKIGEAKVILEGYFGEESGDLLVDYSIVCPASSCKSPTVTPPTAPPPTPNPPLGDHCTPEQKQNCTKVSTEEYWQIQLERQKAMKAYLQSTLAIYQKYGGATSEARNELMALEEGHTKRMNDILAKHGLNSTADLMPNEPCRQQILQERQEYMQNHPELREKFMSMSTEMRDLKDQITHIP